MKNRKRFSLEERKLILADYQSGNLTQKEIAFKYGIHTRSLLSTWSRDLENPEKEVTLHREKTETAQSQTNLSPQTSMAKKETKTPEEEITELRTQLLHLRHELDWEKKRTLALETLIEVAEAHGMPVKKCGAKQ